MLTSSKYAKQLSYGFRTIGAGLLLIAPPLPDRGVQFANSADNIV